MNDDNWTVDYIFGGIALSVMITGVALLVWYGS